MKIKTKQSIYRLKVEMKIKTKQNIQVMFTSMVLTFSSTKQSI